MTREKAAKREAGSLPRAFWRLDPNIDQTHEAHGEMVRLICVAGRQPRRGRFKNRAAFYAVFGRRAAQRCMSRGDVIEHTTSAQCAATPEHERFCAERPHLYVDGWDEWQESDLDVGTRMRRLREKKRRARQERGDDADASNPDDRRNAVTPADAAPAVTPLRPNGPVAPSPERNAVTTGSRRQAAG
jgi:hypothetical protein